MSEDTVNPDPLANRTRVHRAEVVHPWCAECVRLSEQGRAAVLTHDASRLLDVTVLQKQHGATEHGRAVRL
jgi:hypothetical protein